MASHVTERTVRRPRRVPPAPPVIDGPRVHGSATVMVVDPDDARRARTRNALGNLPARIVCASSRADAFVAASAAPPAVVMVEGSDDPDGAVDFVRRLRQGDPFFVPILIGIESNTGALTAAVNDAGAFRVLPSGATRYELRSAALAGLAAERDRRFLARLGRPWVRSLFAKIERAVPAPVLAALDEKGSELPFDLVMRPGATLRRDAGRSL